MAAGFMKTALTLLCVLQMEKKSCALFVLFSFSTVGAIYIVHPSFSMFNCQ